MIDHSKGTIFVPLNALLWQLVQHLKKFFALDGIYIWLAKIIPHSLEKMVSLTGTFSPVRGLRDLIIKINMFCGCGFTLRRYKESSQGSIFEEDQFDSPYAVEMAQRCLYTRGERRTLTRIRQPSQIQFKRSAAPSPESLKGDSASYFGNDEGRGYAHRG